MKWAQVNVTTSQDASDATANCLFELDATGLEIKDAAHSTSVSLLAYFPLDDLVGERIRRLRQFLKGLPDVGIDPAPAQISLKTIDAENWAEEWRSAFPPRKIGERLIIAPTWHHITPDASEILIRLDPGMAFGTGQHPTTELSIALLEEAIKAHDIVADIGTGSGILAIAAAKLGARRVDAVDLDETTIPIAQRNFQINAVTSIVRLHSGDGLKVLDGRYDLIVANILTKVLLPMIPHCRKSVQPGGRIILSGILASEGQQIEAQLRANGFRPIKTRRQEGWVGVMAERDGTSV